MHLLSCIMRYYSNYQESDVLLHKLIYLFRLLNQLH